MLVDRSKLEDYLTERFSVIIVDSDKCMQMYDYAYEKYNMPRGLFADWVSCRKSLEDSNQFDLFVMMDSYEYVSDGKRSIIHKYFSDKEISVFQNEKYEINDKVKFPLKFKMVQISDDQWIGQIDVNTIMKLCKSQLINYNQNTQRTMRRIVRGENIIYKIMLNKKAVSEISDSMLDGSFIPNTITLNIPVESEDADFYYDELNSTMCINHIDHFDINDGYHRYMGICKAKEMNPDFNYNMELRITNFPEDKSQRFTFQEDQKTKMSKVSSNSFDVYAASNVVTKRLNESSDCNIRGLIGRNAAHINMGELSTVINYLYFSNTKKSEEKKLIIKTTRELINDFNILTEKYDKYLDITYDFRTTLIIVTAFKYFQDKDKSNMPDIIDKSIEKSYGVIDNRKFYGKRLTKVLINNILDIIKEEEGS